MRTGSRAGHPPFDWDDARTWAPALDGVAAAYVTYYPDLAVPAAEAAVTSFAELALKSGVRRLVLLSGRGEEGAGRSERALQQSGADWTILRSSWFNPNFSESFLLQPVLAGELALPVGEIREPFVDANDVADVAVAALTDDSHIGQLYELTGPRALTFREAAAEIAAATGRPIRYETISLGQFASGLEAAGVPPETTTLIGDLFTEVLDVRNSRVTDGVARALGRQPRDFSDYAREAAASGAWEAQR